VLSDKSLMTFCAECRTIVVEDYAYAMTNHTHKKVQPTKVSSVEEEYGVKFNVRRRNMNLGTFFEQQGLPSLAKVLKKAEQHSQQR
jgi:hypothetical protein